MPSSGNEAPRLQIDLPSSFSMRRHSGPDFDVFYFSDPSTGSSMGLYSGHHPGLRSREAGVTHVSSQPGRVGDIPVEWSRWSQAGEYRSETLVHDFYGRNAPRGYVGIILHLFTVATTERDVERMQAAAATLRLERPR